MKTTFLLAVIASLILSACSDSANVSSQDNREAKKEPAERKISSNSGAKIRNDIDLKTKELKVSQAFLLYEDGKLVPETNETNVGTPVKMRLIIEDGWKVQDGKVSLGASEKIETSEGETVLDEKDLFESIGSVSPEDAKYISLTANISRLNKLYDYFLVSFRVWDKNGTGEVTGSYKLYIK